MMAKQISRRCTCSWQCMLPIHYCPSIFFLYYANLWLHTPVFSIPVVYRLSLLYPSPQSNWAVTCEMAQPNNKDGGSDLTLPRFIDCVGVCRKGNKQQKWGKGQTLTSSAQSHIPRRADWLLRPCGPAFFVCALSAGTSKRADFSS